MDLDTGKIDWTDFIKWFLVMCMLIRGVMGVSVWSPTGNSVLSPCAQQENPRQHQHQHQHHPSLCPISLLLAGVPSCGCPRHYLDHNLVTSAVSHLVCRYTYLQNMLKSCRHSWGLLSLPESWAKVLQIRLESAPVTRLRDPQSCLHIIKAS